MTEVRNLFADKQPIDEPADVGPSFVEMARTIASICATRILLLIAVLTGAAIWAFTIYDPTRDRLLASIAFSVVFVGPQVALYWRRG